MRLHVGIILAHLVAGPVTGCVPAPAWAKDIELFDRPGEQTWEYDRRVAPPYAEAGDVFVFSNGARFRIESELGSGATTRVYRARQLTFAGGRPAGESAPVALRVPRRSGDIIGVNRHGNAVRAPVSAYINQTVAGHRLLDLEKVPIPELIDSLSGEYVAMELVAHDFTGEDFFLRPERISPRVLADAEEDLRRFARSTGPFTSIGDFKPDQIVYSHEERCWILLDWIDDHASRKIALTRAAIAEDAVFGRAFAAYLGTDALGQPRRLAPREERILASLRKERVRAAPIRRLIGCVVDLLARPARLPSAN